MTSSTVESERQASALASAAASARPVLAHSPRPLLRFLRYGGISAAIGVGVVLLLSLNQPDHLSQRELLGGVVMGLLIGSGSILMELLVLRPLVRLGLRPVLLARSLSFFVGGSIGYWLGLLVNTAWFGLAEWADSPQNVRSMLFYGMVAVVVGLTFHTVETLESNLEETASELREREYAERELATARLIQKRLMPPELTSGPGFALAAHNRAASIVAGDFYDYFHLPDGSMGFAVADVAGKGLGASLQMATVKAMLPLVAATHATSDDPVAGTLRELNERLFRELGSREFVAMLYGRFDPEGGTMEFSNAGLPDPYWLPDDASACGQPVMAMSVPGERLPLGIRRDTHYESTKVEADGAGTMLLLTDGLVERTAQDGPLGYDRFEAILADLEPNRDVEAWLETLQARLNSECGGAPEEDDCTAMAIRCEPEAASGVDALRAATA